MENLFLQIFERKRRIVEQVKHQINLYDQQLASKCILEGVTPPEWLWSPSFPSQTSELNKEEIISGLLFSHSRPSNIYASSRGFSYQQPFNFLVDNVQTFKLNQHLQDQSLEEDQQHDLSHNNLEEAGCVPSSAHEQDPPNVASARDFQEEIIPKSASTCFEQNVSCLCPEYSQNNKVETGLDGTAPGYIRGERVTDGFSTTGCELKTRCTSPRCCPDEAEPGISLDPTLSLARIQRSKSRQRALELRSSAKASKSQSKSINNLQASPAENLGYEIASLRLDSVNGIELFEHNENEEEVCREEAVENNNSQDKERDQFMKFSTTKSTSTSEKVDSVRKSSVDNYASVAPDSRDPKSLFESGIVDEMDLSQQTNTSNEVSTKEEGKVNNSQRKTCSEIIHLDRVSRSESLANGFSFKNEKTKLRDSCSGELRSRSSNASPRAGQEIELPQYTVMKNEACMQIEAGMSNSLSQNVYSERVTRSRNAAQGCRSKTEHLGKVDFSSVDLQSRHSVASPQCDDERKLLKPTTVSGEGFLVEDYTDDKQWKEKGESIDTSIVSRSESLGQDDSMLDESTEVGQIQDSKSKAEYLGQFELSSIELQPRHSAAVLQSGDERELLKPPTVSEKCLSVQEDSAGGKLCKEKDESIHPSRISTVRSLGQAEISVDDPAVVGEFALQENGVVSGDLVEHSTTSDVSGGSKVVQPNSSWIKPESSHHGKISRLRSSSIQEDLATEYEAPSVSSEHELVDEQLDSGVVNSPSNTLHNLPAPVKLEPLHFNDDEEQNFDEMLLNYREESAKGDGPIPAAAAREINASSPTDPEINLLVDSKLSAIVEHDGREKERIPARESPIGGADLEAGESEHAEANTGLSINNISNVCIVASTNSLKRRLNPSVPNNSSDNSAQSQAAGKSSLCEMSKEQPLSCLSNLSANKEIKVPFEEDIYQLDVFKHALSTSNKRSEEKTIAEDSEREMKADLCVGEWNQSEQSLHQVQTSFGKGCCPHTGQNIACTESREVQAPESSIREFCQSSPFTEISHLQNKRRRTLDKLAHGMPSSASLPDDALDSGSAEGKHGTVHHSVECLSLSHYDVELQKMIGSASSTELRLDEGYLLKEVGFKSPATLTFKSEQLGELGSQTIPIHGVGSEYTDIVPSGQETSHLLASRVSHDSIGLICSDDGSLPVLEGFIIQTDDEDQSGSHDQINLDCLRLPKTTVERASVLEQICRSACMSTPSLQLSTSFKFDEKPKLNQSVPNRLLESMLVSSSLQTKDDESKKLEGGSVVVYSEIDHAFHGRSHSDCLPLSGAGSASVETRNIYSSPSGKLWYRSMQKSASSEKRGTLSPDLPCIAEENETIDEQTEKLWSGNTPKSASSEKRGSSSPDLPCIAEENENADESFEAVREYSQMNNASAERKPLLVVNENIEFPAAVSEAKVHVDRQSLDSVNTAFSFTATCNSVKSKLGKQNGGTRRSTVKGKENRGISRGTARKIEPLINRSSKPKLSGNSSLTIQGPRLSEKEPRQNNIVSNITSFIPLVQQPKPASELITGKRDVKVKALEAAEAAKRLAEKKENERKMKKEALKLERARQEQENQRKQEMEKQKKEERKRKEAEMAERKKQKDDEEKKLKEEERKRKEAEMAERKRQREEEEKKLKEEERKRKEAEMVERKRQREEEEKRLKEEERKRKEAEMAERKRQREEEDKKLKEPKRKRIAGAHKQQQREPEAKLLAGKGEQESKTQAMEASSKALKELRHELGNAMKTAKEQANSRLQSTKSDISEDSKRMSSVGDISKVTGDLGRVSDETSRAGGTTEESYDISPYKCSDDEDEDEDEDVGVRNNKFVPAWASKSCVLLAVSSQQSVDPVKIFPPKSFCSIEEVLLPRRLRSR
ncbi:PREDICTED: uncharacterized protein LOC104811669 [Tarenaya hassleriana]|uniref:uncharacterized protein LOC104811669 n=1 Tax=Tarenaya hassleriana TaxID=28532 RepID=UPI00053C0A51|nr:PREDICTED: uncharacterized protein LOC104811669 [Tarenaya hassleriana]